VRTIASLLTVVALNNQWISEIQNKFGISVSPKEPDKQVEPWIVEQIYNILKMVPKDLLTESNLKQIQLSYIMGPNKPYYPNHGYYIPNKIVLNANIFYHPDTPDDFYDDDGNFIDRPTQTLLHEIGHAYDACCGNLSLMPDWISISGWSKDSLPGLKRLVIKDSDKPAMVGEWYYDPSAEFTRFYAKRNPEDDWADTFAFYIGDMKNRVPEKKRRYFDKKFN
jgi:hypothetical protein